MNQILSVEISRGKSKKSSIKSIIVVFAILLMIFGIGITATGVYAYYENNIKTSDKDSLVLISNTKPQITVERENAYKIKIVVTHDKELNKVTYTINDGETVEIPTNNQKEIEQVVEFDPGTYKVKIVAEDKKGASSSHESGEILVEEKPKITLEQSEGKIKATIESKINIDTVTYYWDEDTANAKNYTINDVKNQTIIDVLEGVHTLTIKATDIEGRETKETKKIIGDSKPILTVVTDGKDFIINASDDEGLIKVEITLNSKSIVSEELKTMEYAKNIALEDGENKLIVKVYNKNGISAESKVKYTKE